ncbi:MAG TPA: exopolysaccharide biosynthesis protein [Thermoleophilaceae bacterium]|nr:exopolysaccharide biosynthesis protein [Thermoleophilaceae bacterium]
MSSGLDEPEQGALSRELETWLDGPGEKTLGALIDVFDRRSFAIVFVLLMGVPALPLPTGGATHVFELITVLLALQLVAGRDRIWLPQRWRRREVATDGRFVTTLIKVIRRLERLSRPRLRFVFGRRLSNVLFGLVVASLSVAAFLAPPFTGLDTLPALGVVLVSLGVLLEDFLLVAVGLLVGAVGVLLVLAVGEAVLDGLRRL